MFGTIGQLREWFFKKRLELILYSLRGRAVLMTSTRDADRITYYFNYEGEDGVPRSISVQERVKGSTGKEGKAGSSLRHPSLKSFMLRAEPLSGKGAKFHRWMRKTDGRHECDRCGMQKRYIFRSFAAKDVKKDCSSYRIWEYSKDLGHTWVWKRQRQPVPPCKGVPLAQMEFGE